MSEPVRARTPIEFLPLAPPVSTRGGNVAASKLTATPGEDVVAVTLGNGLSPDLTLYLAPENAQALLKSQAGSGGAAAASRGLDPTASPDAVALPTRAAWPMTQGAAAERGLVSDVFFKAIEVLGLKDDLVKSAAKVVGAKVDKQVKPGVYALTTQPLSPLKTKTPVKQMLAAPNAEPLLVLVHGTFVETVSTFGKWWTEHPDLVTALFEAYDDRVYALDHPTMMVSPIGNALTLAEACPKGARLHLVTHSRGGLVAEVLTRVCGGAGVNADDDKIFEGEAYAQHRDDLKRLTKLVRERGIKVDRVVRVACPAHGTLLASGRLDAYLSVFSWLVGKTGLPLLPDLVDFAKAVARERTDPATIPGIEAMMPGSPLVRWLNETEQAVDGQLRVVAGDLDGDSLMSWIKVLLGNGFFWTANDLVVDTRSMYGGAMRKGSAVFVLENNGGADHFSYFRNRSTADAIARALIEDAPNGFTAIGPLSRAGQQANGSRGLIGREETRIVDATARAEAARGDRPCVIIVPGIMGSHLRSPQGREWFAISRLHGLMDRIEWKADQDRIVEDGPIEDFYGGLALHLEATHDVIGFGFDWRRPMEDEGRRLGSIVDRELRRRQSSQQPVRILAHSMGGLITRVMQLEKPDVWQAMFSHRDARVVMLGTPNNGSWAPMTILTGDDVMGRALSGIAGFPLSERRMRQRTSELPGLMSMQAGLNKHDLHLQGTWEDWGRRDLAAAREAMSWHLSGAFTSAYEWAIPPQAVLDHARRLQERLTAQAPALRQAADRMAVVLGRADGTPCGVRWNAQDMLDYEVTTEGDGRVPWTSTLLDGVSTWFVPAIHGDLPKTESAFGLYTDLLVRGQSEPSWAFREAPGARGARGAGAGASAMADAAPLTTARPSRAPQPFDAVMGDRSTVLRDVMRGFAQAAPRSAPPPPAVPPVRIIVVNGDVRFVREPLLLGHTKSLQLTGAEKFVSPLLGGILQASVERRLYPEMPGQHQVFVNRYRDPGDPFGMPRPDAAVVVGLGDEGDVKLPVLRQAVRDGVLAYARHLWEEALVREDGIAAPVRDADSAGFTLAAMLLGSGSSATVADSAMALAQGVGDANRQISLQPPGQRWPYLRQLQIIELYLNRATEAVHTLVEIAEQSPLTLQLDTNIQVRPSGQPRPKGVGYRGADHDLIRVSASASATLEYSLFTRRSRSEIRAKATQPKLVDQMLKTAQGDTAFDSQLAKSLYQLLLPLELQAHVSAGCGLLLEVDSHTARYPWELLDDGRGEDRCGTAEPLTVRRQGGLLRKMRVTEFNRHPQDSAGTDKALVLGPPRLEGKDAELYPPLPGAVAEAQAVSQVLGAELLIDAAPLQAVKAALSRPWRILHMAGHGIYDPDGNSGMVMAGGTVLGPREFESMAVVPELVFINCCHLGQTGPASTREDRHLLAANVAEQLIRNGVRCVVAAGWAVSDRPAEAFATKFYELISKGSTFQYAVEEARRAAYTSDPCSNTWAAYQCYGDPHWRLSRPQDDTPRRAARPPLVCSAADMELLLTDLRLRGIDADDRQRNLLEEELDALWAEHADRFNQDGRVLEAMGYTCLALYRKERALDYLARALSAEDGAATMRARETLLNHRARMAKTPATILSVIGDIEALLHIGATSERWALLGSAWKRMALLDDLPEAKLYEALCHMHEAYFYGEQLEPLNLHYPLSQRLWAECRLHWWHPMHPAPLPEDVQRLRQAITEMEARGKPDFWSVVAQHETDVMAAVLQGRLGTSLGELCQRFEDTHRRVRLPTYWESVYDNARFTLAYYLRKAPAHAASPDEAAAVQALLDLFKSFARAGS